jgi:hypothetical protein
MKHDPPNLPNIQWMLLNGILNDYSNKVLFFTGYFNAIFYLIQTRG